MTKLQFQETLTMRSCNPVLRSWRQACIWLALFLLPLALESMANEVNHKAFKTPAEASVSFQVFQEDFPHVICSGARISRLELITSTNCVKKLKLQHDLGSKISALSSQGENYGEIRPVSEADSETAIAPDTEQLSTVLLKSPGSPNNRWPVLHKKDFLQNSVALQSYSSYERDKQHIESEWFLDGCNDKQCSLQNDSNLNLNDGEAVFQNGKLLCVNADGDCIRGRSVKRINDGSCRLKCFQCLVTDPDYCIEGSGSGTCVNQKNNQSCEFFSDQTPIGDYNCPWGYCSSVSCPVGCNPLDAPDKCKCETYYGYRSDNNCTSLYPDNCIGTTGNCAQCSVDTLIPTIATIVGVIGGAALIGGGVILTVCLIANRHRLGYRRLNN
jgi:hypothetical protein